MAGLAEQLARRIFAVVFGEAPSHTAILRFSEGFEQLWRDADPAEVELLRRAVENVRHLGALEVAARYTHRLPLLVDAFRLLLYIAEAEPANQRFFVKRERSVSGAIAALFLGALHTFVSVIAGLVLLRRLKA
jgi:hypothetical protein